MDALAAQMAAQEAQAPPQVTRMGRFVVRPAADAPRSEDTIVEEMVGAPGQPSPTVYMVGRRVAVVADQLLSPCGTLNMGNVSPAAQVDALLTDAMSAACVELGTYLGLVGQWGVDFVLDELGTPVMVDLNMGRPNGSLSYFCWRARQPDPQFALVASTFCLPEGLTLAPFAKSLKAAGRLWDAKRRSGIILAQHLPGSPDGGTVLAASCEGTAAARHVLDGFFTHATAYLADLQEQKTSTIPRPTLFDMPAMNTTRPAPTEQHQEPVNIIRRSKNVAQVPWDPDDFHVPKPTWAPPARRRIVSNGNVVMKVHKPTPKVRAPVGSGSTSNEEVPQVGSNTRTH